MYRLRREDVVARVKHSPAVPEPSRRYRPRAQGEGRDHGAEKDPWQGLDREQQESRLQATDQVRQEGRCDPSEARTARAGGVVGSTFDGATCYMVGQAADTTFRPMTAEHGLDAETWERAFNAYLDQVSGCAETPRLV